MSDGEMTLKIGEVEFHARGTQEWVSEMLETVVERLAVGRPAQGDPSLGHVNDAEKDQVVEGSPPRAAERWLKHNEISDQHIDHIFDRGRDGLELILDNVPGSKTKSQVINLYMLTGVKAFLETGDAFFADKEARVICEKFGCLDSKHHAEHLAGMGNRFSGSKEHGWKLTTPGMSDAAALIKLIAT